MRKLAALALLAFACASPAPLPPPTPAPPADPHGLTIEEEAGILALEDRREHNAEVVNAWIAHPNPNHRLRIALALGRIGSVSLTGTKTGVPELTTLSKDTDRRVRETTAFALGEIGLGAET